MQPPQVQSIEEIMKMYDPLYAARRNDINTQIQQAPQYEQAALSQADALKNQAFGQITQGAQNKGLFFSGIPLAEQAGYLATQYAPKVLGVKQDTMKQQGLLRSTLSELAGEQSKMALGTQQDQQKQAMTYSEARRAEEVQRQRDQQNFQQLAM